MNLPLTFQIVIGFIGLILLAIPLSNKRSAINYKSIVLAIGFQILLAFALIKVPIIIGIFSYLSDGVIALQESTNEGATFVFGYLASGETPFVESGQGSSLIFAFAILPLILVMSSLTAVLWFWGICH